jgi:hypothetical protein
MSRVFGVLCLLFVTKSEFSLPCPNTKVTEDEIIPILEQYEVSASQKCRDYNLAAWNYNTDVENASKVEELVSTCRITSLHRLILSLYIRKLVEMRFKGAVFRRNTSVHIHISRFLYLHELDLRHFSGLRKCFRYINLLFFVQVSVMLMMLIITQFSSLFIFLNSAANYKVSIIKKSKGNNKVMWDRYLLSRI